MADIICSGFGGQGALTAGMIIINAGVKVNKYVTWCPSYGSEMRGGTANCNVVVSDEEIGSPYVVTLDILIAMNEPSVDKFEHMVKPGGQVFVNESIVSKDREYREDIRVYKVSATDIANSLQNPRGINIVMLGAVIKASELFDKQLFIDTINQYFGKKGKATPKNIECFNCGYEAI